MDHAELRCPDCTAEFDAADNYCRQCGMYLVAMRPTTALVSRDSLAVEAVRPGLPAPVRKVATAVAVGAALQVGLGLAGRYFAAQGSQRAARAVLANAPRANRGVTSRRDEAVDRDPLADAAAVSETVIVRRVWIRRG